MKANKILSLLLVLALSVSALFSCKNDKEGEEEKAPDYYAKFSDIAEKNGKTKEYTYTEATSEDITSLEVSGLTSAFLFSNKSYEQVLVYNFDTEASANTFKTENEGAFSTYGYVTKLYGNVLAIGDETMIDILETGKIHTEEPLPDYCEYKDTRDVTGRETVTVKMTVRDHGEITLLLDATTAPVTVANFTKLVSEGFYDGLTFHRVIEDFMIQGGDPDANGGGGSDEEIFGEFSSNGHENDISHIRGVISMARSNDPDSASSQFFICNADSTFLDGSYAAFGYVIEGMSTVDSITEATSKYGDSNGTIATKALHAVIEEIVIVED